MLFASFLSFVFSQPPSLFGSNQVSEMAVSELPGNPNAVWTVRRHVEGICASHTPYSSIYIPVVKCQPIVRSVEPGFYGIDWQGFILRLLE